MLVTVMKTKQIIHIQTSNHTETSESKRDTRGA